MVDIVLELKGFINDMDEIIEKNLQPMMPQWKQVLELRDLLKKVFEFTKKLQAEDLNPGYFYRKWCGLHDIF